jgi:hypothetical protein
MDKFLSKITQWGWKKGHQKELSLIEQATRSTPQEHKMFQPNVGWVFLMIFMIFGFTTVAFVFVGHPLYQALENLLIQGGTTIGLAVYGFYLAWFIPAILLGTTLMQLLLTLLPKVGNTYTATDMVRTIAIEEGDLETQQLAQNYTLKKNIILEKTKFLDLAWVRRQGFKKMAQGTLITTLIFLPFMLLTINTHFSKLEDNTLVYSRFFQIGSETIEIKDIDLVTVEMDWEEDHLEPHYEIELNDGRSIDLWELGMVAPDLDRILEIATYLDRQGVFHFIIPPSDMSTLNEKTRTEFTQFYESLRAL